MVSTTWIVNLTSWFILNAVYKNGNINSFILVGVTVDLDPIPGTLGGRWEYTLIGMDTHSHLGVIWSSQSTSMFWGGNRGTQRKPRGE